MKRRDVTRRWFDLLIGAFPQQVRSERGEEMRADLDEVAPRGRALIGESTALLAAAIGAWNRRLRTADGLLAGGVFGAVLWTGALLSLGPAVRVLASAQNGGAIDGSAIMGIGLVLTATALVRRSMVAALAVAAVGIMAIADANTVGPWGFVEATWYELRWLGVPIALAAMLGRRLEPERTAWATRRGGFATAIGTMCITALPVGVVSLLEWDLYQTQAARNYAISLRWDVIEPAWELFAAGWWQWVPIVAVGVLVALLFAHPVHAAVAAPAALHLAMVSPIDGVLPACLVAAALAWRPISRRVEVDLRMRRN